jgi:hypothetical protein
MSGVGGGNGTAKADSLMKGEYAFALLNPLVNLPRLQEVGLSIFPNPVTEACLLKADYQGNVHIEIYDINGRIIQTEQVYLNGLQGHEISVQSLSNQVYEIQLKNTEGEVLGTVSLIKQD